MPVKVPNNLPAVQVQSIDKVSEERGSNQK